MEAVLRALALQGERASALTRFDEFRSRLEERLQVPPSSGLQALAERVRREKAGVSRHVQGLPEPSQRRRAPLVGREVELHALLGAWATVRARREPGFAAIIGDPGTGKSRLAAEFAARARLDGALVAVVRAVPADLQAPGSGALALAGSGFESAPGVSSAAPEAISLLAERVASWGERYPSKQPRKDATPITTPAAALLEVLRAVAEVQPVVLWVDDAHFLDHDTFGMLEALPREAAGSSVLALLTATAEPREELDRIRARIGRELPGVSVGVGPLGPEAIRALAGWALPQYTPTEVERLSRRLALDSAGLPLLVLELLDAVAGGLELTGQDGAWPHPFRTLTETMPADVPDSIRAAVRVSFRRVSSNGQRVLGAVAVLGDRVVPGDVAVATGLPVAVVLEALDELEWTRWLESEPRGYGFAARVVRDIVAADMLTAGQRRRLAEALGRQAL